MLTPREEQIVMLLTQGLTNRQIALRLSLSHQTVKNYLSGTQQGLREGGTIGVYRKLGIVHQQGSGARVQAALWWDRQQRQEAA